MMKLSNTNGVQEQQTTVCVHCDHVHAATELCCSAAEAVLSPGSNDALIGQILGEKYQIEEKVGAGGMCQVYRATQVLIGKTVALKLLRPQLAVDQQLVRRFEQEASALGRLCHPHAINVFDFGFTEQDCPYLVMDFISGRTLNEVIHQDGPLSVARANRLLGQICGALQAAHTEGIIHRDIKPENILISEADGKDWATVVDFGVAKLQEDINQKTSLTGEGIIIGTPRYMSPEQSEGKTVDTRSDIYSLGVVLYEMLAGEAPFTDNSSTRLLIKHISELPPPLREKRPDLSEEIEAVVMQALAKTPEARPASALELSKAFEQAAAGELQETPPHAVTQVVVPLNGGAANTVEHQAEEADITKLRTAVSPQTEELLRFVPRRRRARHSRRTSSIVAISALVLVLAFGFIYHSQRTEAVNPFKNVVAAQQTITLAINQISLLPPGHLLRDQLAQLNEWQQELGRYATAPTLLPATQTRIQTMEQLAKNYVEQAQLAVKQPAPGTNLNANTSAKDNTLVEGAEKAQQDKPLKDAEAREANAERRRDRKPVKGPNKFTRVIKKMFLVP